MMRIKMVTTIMMTMMKNTTNTATIKTPSWN